MKDPEVVVQQLGQFAQEALDTMHGKSKVTEEDWRRWSQLALDAREVIGDLQFDLKQAQLLMQSRGKSLLAFLRGER